MVYTIVFVYLDSGHCLPNIKFLQKNILVESLRPKLICYLASFVSTLEFQVDSHLHGSSN